MSFRAKPRKQFNISSDENHGKKLKELVSFTLTVLIKLAKQNMTVNLHRNAMCLMRLIKMSYYDSHEIL